MMRHEEWQDNVVILTGASSGIGRQLALQLAARGAYLVLASRNSETLKEVAEQCRQIGGRVLVVPTDVADQSRCRDLIERAKAEFGGIDTLINNAGFGLACRFDELSVLNLFEKVIQVNFLGSVYCTHYALPYLKKSKGRLVAVSSLRGRFASATADGYGASKHAMAGFFDSLRLELAESEVSVTVIYPGWVATGISSRALDSDGKPTGVISKHEKGAMPPDTCARLIREATGKREREVVMTIGGRLGLWMKLIAPAYVDRISSRATG